MSETVRAVDLGLANKLKDTRYFRQFFRQRLADEVSMQIRARREQLGLTQADLAMRLGTKQSGVSRLENPSYAKMSMRTLLEVADELDCRLIVSMEPKEIAIARYKP